MKHVCVCVLGGGHSGQGGTLDGRSTVGGCARNAYVHEAQGCTSRSGGQCDKVPSLQMSVCSDCHTMEPGSLVWQSECMFGTL